MSGRVVPCPRCGGNGEVVIGNYVSCRACDRPAPVATAASCAHRVEIATGRCRNCQLGLSEIEDKKLRVWQGDAFYFREDVLCKPDGSLTPRPGAVMWVEITWEPF